jgi:hypothetical protein
MAGLRACSACSGDYEDPESAAWSDASEEEDDVKNVNAGNTNAFNPRRSVPRERLPVQEQ